MGLQDIGYTEGAGKDVATIEKSEGGVTRQIERVALDTDQLALGGAAILDQQNAPGTESSALDVTGKTQVVLKPTFSTATDTATILIKYEDFQGTPGATYGQQFSIANTGIADGARYHGEVVVVQNIGAKQIKARLMSITGGNLSLIGCAL